MKIKMLVGKVSQKVMKDGDKEVKWQEVAGMIDGMPIIANAPHGIEIFTESFQDFNLEIKPAKVQNTYKFKIIPLI